MFVENYCRLCAMKIENCIKIYDEEGEKLNLATKIIQCLQIWLYPEDVLPKTVCTDCCSKVNLFFDFFQLSSQSQISLMSMFKGKDEEQKIMMNEIEEINNENNLDQDYQDDDNSESRDVCNDYIELAVPEKALSKRKLRTPIKRSIPEGCVEGDQEPEQHCAQALPTIRKSNRKCKKTPKLKLMEDDEEDEEEEEESEDEDEPKLSAKGMEGYSWKCTDCAMELKTLSELRRHHAEVHNQAPIFACMHCSKSYTRYRSFARHVKMHSNPKKFSCEVCGKCFSQKTVLQSHATVHSEERPHSCAQCGKCFKQFSSLYLHSKCHLPEQAKPRFPCSQCPKEANLNKVENSKLKDINEKVYLDKYRREKELNAARQRRYKAKMSIEKLAEKRQRDRDRYHRLKKENKIKLIAEMSEKEKKYTRKLWRKKKANYRIKQNANINLMSTSFNSNNYDRNRVVIKTSPSSRQEESIRITRALRARAYLTLMKKKCCPSC